MQPGLFLPSSFTVTELTRYVRQLLESDFLLQDVWVQGEISNLSRPSSGHIYFTLKDESSAIKCVIWRSSAARLRFALQNGMAIEAHGAISVYERDGQYQLYVNNLRPAGEGVLYQQFMRLKARLEEEGLFDEERKRPLPAMPGCIGIVTSATGAALQDMLNTLRVRYPLAEVILAPCAVQGEEAPGQIVAALRGLNRSGKPDVILLARGGGSLEDLWAFNDERVVRAVTDSLIPVVTGVGHETDFTLVDFASDLRAPTPTGAAVLATPDVADLRANLRGAVIDLVTCYSSIVERCRSQSREGQARLVRVSPAWRVRNNRQRLDEVDARLENGMRHRLALRRSQWQGGQLRLRSLDPRAVLQRGYAIVRKAQDGAIVRSVQAVQPGEGLRVQVSDGQFDARVQPEDGDRPD
jgi:exodeoxyribonuclease VII large subunit